MFAEHGAIELVFLAAVALIVVGPKDLPVLMRKVGQITAKMRGLAAEFRSSFEELARQSELDELRKEVEALRQGQLGLGEHQTEIEQHFDELHHALHPTPDSHAGDYPAVSYGREEDEDQPDLPFHGSPPSDHIASTLDWKRVEPAHEPARPEPARELRA